MVKKNIIPANYPGSNYSGYTGTIPANYPPANYPGRINYPRTLNTYGTADYPVPDVPGYIDPALDPTAYPVHPASSSRIPAAGFPPQAVTPTSASRALRNIYTAEEQRREIFVETIKRDIEEIQEILRNLDVPYEVMEKPIIDLGGECSGIFLPKNYANKQAIVIIKEKI